MTNTLWILIVTGIVAVLATWLTRSPGRGKQVDLGFVSHQWVTEHRLSQMADSPR
jgi:hypothetical protein